MKLTFPIPFAKLSGSGNDFIVIDHRQPFLDGVNLTEFTKAVCRRKFAVGADGLILIENSETADFSWQFFNGDGSVAEMCGNGARCAARFAYEKKIAPAFMRFVTLAGEIEAFIDQEAGDSVKIRLTPPTDIVLHQQLEVAGESKTVHAINTGVPHAVLMVDDARRVPVVDWGRPVRYHEVYGTAGTNVNFVQISAANALTVRTYERGVEDETMACGTGAVASAIVAALLGKVEPPVKVTTLGGDELTIYFTVSEEKQQASGIEDVFLEGRADLIYEGRLEGDSVRDMTE